MQIDRDSIVSLKFQPSDQLLVGYHLCKKVTSKEPLDFETIIQECDLYGEKEPWEIWETYRGNGLKPKEDRYFFTRLKKKISNGKRINRTIGSGTWKGVDSGKPIFIQGYDKPMGFKKLFRYEGGRQQNGGWILHEYSLHNWVLHQKSMEQTAEEYVLFRIRNNTEKKRPFAEEPLKRDACSNHFKVEETAVRVESNMRPTAAQYSPPIGELGDHNESLFKCNPQVLPLPIAPVGVSKSTMLTTFSQGIDGLEIGELGDNNNGSLSKDMRSEEASSIVTAVRFECTATRRDELQPGNQDGLAKTELGNEFRGSHASTEMYELTKGQGDVGQSQTNIGGGESGACSASPCKHSSPEEVPTSKPSGSNNLTTSAQPGYGDISDIPLGDLAELNDVICSSFLWDDPIDLDELLRDLRITQIL